MKICPHCKAELDDSARFCLCCMTSLDEKEQIPPPVSLRLRWPLVLLGCFVASACLLIVGIALAKEPSVETPNQLQTQPTTVPVEEVSLQSCTVDGVRYTFRPANQEDHPSGLPLGNYYVLVGVEGTPADGIYRVPTFVGEDTGALVTVVADGAFAGTNARKIDLGHNVRYVWGDAFGGNALTDLYLHEDVQILKETFSGCTKDLTIHCPEYLENTKGEQWCDLAISYGFRWQQEVI